MNLALTILIGIGAGAMVELLLKSEIRRPRAAGKSEIRPGVAGKCRKENEPLIHANPR
jgi:hypothetical protein